MYREDQSGASFVLGMMTGAFIGAGVALLLPRNRGQKCESSWASSIAGSPNESARRPNTSGKARSIFVSRGASECSSFPGNCQTACRRRPRPLRRSASPRPRPVCSGPLTQLGALSC